MKNNLTGLAPVRANLWLPWPDIDPWLSPEPEPELLSPTITSPASTLVAVALRSYAFVYSQNNALSSVGSRHGIWRHHAHHQWHIAFKSCLGDDADKLQWLSDSTEQLTVRAFSYHSHQCPVRLRGSGATLDKVSHILNQKIPFFSDF